MLIHWCHMRAVRLSIYVVGVIISPCNEKNVSWSTHSTRFRTSVYPTLYTLLLVPDLPPSLKRTTQFQTGSCTNPCTGVRTAWAEVSHQAQHQSQAGRPTFLPPCLGVRVLKGESGKLDNPWANLRALAGRKTGKRGVDEKTSGALGTNISAMTGNVDTALQERINATSERRISRRRESALRRKVKVFPSTKQWKQSLGHF